VALAFRPGAGSASTVITTLPAIPGEIGVEIGTEISINPPIDPAMLGEDLMAAILAGGEVSTNPPVEVSITGTLSTDPVVDPANLSIAAATATEESSVQIGGAQEVIIDVESGVADSEQVALSVQRPDALVALLGDAPRDRFGSNLVFGLDTPAGVDPFDYYADAPSAAAAVSAPLAGLGGATERGGADSVTIAEMLEMVEADSEAALPTAEPTALQTSLSNADRTLALITQDMAAFGAKTGEGQQNWNREGIRPVDYFG
jgi:hypothetical protein